MIVEKGLRIVRAQCKNPDRESAVSSGVEHHIDIVGVTGSNPVSRTIFPVIGMRAKRRLYVSGRGAVSFLKVKLLRRMS